MAAFTYVLAKLKRTATGQKIIDWLDIEDIPDAFVPLPHTHPWDTGVTGKPAEFPPEAHTHNADDINAGRLNSARMGSGSANSGTFLRGDGQWANPFELLQDSRDSLHLARHTITVVYVSSSKNKIRVDASSSAVVSWSRPRYSRLDGSGIDDGGTQFGSVSRGLSVTATTAALATGFYVVVIEATIVPRNSSFRVRAVA